MPARSRTRLASSRCLLCPLLLVAWLGAPAPAHAGNQTPEEVGLRDRAGSPGAGGRIRRLHGPPAHDAARPARAGEPAPDQRAGSRGARRRRQEPVRVRRPSRCPGHGLLVHAHRDGADEQWIYLPALRRVRRINSANQSGSFMGSEFAYEDLTPPEVEKFTYR